MTENRTSRYNSLNPKQYMFLMLYIKNQCRNIKECAIKAGYSEKSAESSGRQILQKREAQEVIDELFDRLVVRPHELNAENTLKEIGLIANSDMADFWETDEDGYWKRPKDPKALGKASRCIKKIKFKEDALRNADGEDIGIHREIELEMYSKMDALEMLAKHYKLINGGVDAADKPREGTEIAPRIYLPDNGHGSNTSIKIEFKNK
jgi:hypothetical protein